MGFHSFLSLSAFLTFQLHILLVVSSPVAKDQGLYARKLSPECIIVDDILAVISLPQVSAAAIQFCSSYIKIPLVTSTITSHTTFSPATVTTSTTVTEPAVTATATTTEPDVTTTTTVVVTPAPVTDTFVATSTFTTTTTTLDGAPDKRAVVVLPKALSQFLGSRLSTACSCLSITPSTTVTSTTVATSLATPTVTLTDSSTPLVTTTVSVTPTDTAIASTTLAPVVVDTTVDTTATATAVSITYGIAPQCAATAISNGPVSLKTNTGVEFAAGAVTGPNAPPSQYGPINNVEECCSACYFFNACYAFAYDAQTNSCQFYASDFGCGVNAGSVVTQGQTGSSVGAGPCQGQIF